LNNSPVSASTASPRCQSGVRVKICGITNPEDAEAAIDAGADALGFNGFAGSKRYLDLQSASEWISQLPPLVMRVAVLVNPSMEEALSVLALPGIDLVQFHGDESPDFCHAFSRHGFIKALAARDRDSLAQCKAFRTGSVLLDAFVPGAFGGTGQLIDMALAAEFVREHPALRVILSGGLNPENVGEAVRAVRPYAVDVASGVESHSRKKDPSRMRDFIAAARAAASL
jgi:phosphoribosylanthranilate isomerase